MSKGTVGIVLAGGKSRRMGTDKAFLEIGGVPLIARVTGRLSPLFSSLAVVAKEVGKFRRLLAGLPSPTHNIILLQDLFPEQHPLGGIITALKTFPGKHCFVFACDLPFLNPVLIQAMMREVNGYDVLIPRSRRGLEMLHAIYAGSCLEKMEEAIRRKRWCLESLMKELRTGILDVSFVRTFDPEGLSFLNLNTPQDLKHAQKHLKNRIGTTRIVDMLSGEQLPRIC